LPRILAHRFSIAQRFVKDDAGRGQGRRKEARLYTIVCASQKGGSGKTTLSGHLAVEAVRCGAGPVALIDTDPQGSLAAWWNVRKSGEPHFVKAGLPDLGMALAELDRMGIRIAVIDTPPAITESISQVVAHANLVIVPTRPSPHDLRAVGATVDIAERHDKPLIFVINGATARARITGESAVALSQHGVVAPITIHHRVDFAASMIDGRTVGEAAPNSASAKEIRDLWLYVQDRLSRAVHDPKLLPDIRPDFAVSPLMDVVQEIAAEAPQLSLQASQQPSLQPIPPPPPSEADMPYWGSQYTGPDRRGPPDRRAQAEPYRGPERRGHVFGRRRGDPLLEGSFK
jgi:chromosome partitioning protein